MSATPRSDGEALFEQYLASQGLTFEFEKQHEGRSKRPDYTIEWKGRTIVFDVKEFKPPQTFPSDFGGYYDAYGRIREKIDQGREKFKEFKDIACGLVLHNLGNPFVTLSAPDVMLGAMYGDSGFTFPVNTATGVGDASQAKHAFLGNGKMVRPNWSLPQNTTISALITLGSIPHYELLIEKVHADPNRDIDAYEAELRSTIPNYDTSQIVPRVIVWHNAVARIPFPDDLFRSLFDTHFGIVQVQGEVVTQNVTYRGSCLPASVRV